MISFPKKGSIGLEKDSRTEVPGPCWELLGCAKVLCPAYNRWEIRCWRVANTCCTPHGQSNNAQKWGHCLACPVFKAHAEADPRGWNHFVCDEVKGLMGKDLSALPLRREESLLQILDNLPDGLFIMDKEGRIHYFNRAAEQITGISASDAAGMHCKDIFESTTCETNSKLYENKVKQIGKNIYNKEFTVTRLDGTKVSIISSISVLKDQHGNVIGGVQVFKDISGRKRLEDDLRLSESKYRRIFEGSKDMIFITSRDGLIKDVNQAGVELLGYRSKQELLLLVSVEKVHDNPLHWKVFKKQIDRHGFVKDFEAGFKRKDGTRIHCLVSGNAVRDGDGEIIGYEGIVKDITARMDAIRNVKQRHRELSLLNPVALAMNMTQDLDDVLMTALKKVLEVLNLSCGSIFLIDHEMSAFSLKVQKGLPEGARSNTWQVSLHDHALMRSLLKKNLSLEPKPSFPPFRATLKGLRAHDSTELTCFLITAKEKASGFLALDLPLNRELTEQDTHLLGSLGNFLGGAIENTQLLRTIRKHREELKGLTAKLFQSQELERRRIARELHDEAGQALTAIKLGLDRLERYVTPESEYLKAEIREIRKIIVRTASEIRQLSSRLHPTLLNDLGLEPALNLYFKEVKKHSGLDIEFRMVGFDSRLDVDMETVLYRFSQEALTNTLKHSGADHFRLSIIKSFPKIIFFAGDDGIGFNGQIGGNDKRSLGLIGMRERASLLGGTFQLHARPAEGTRIRIEIPLAEARSHGSTD